MSFITVIITGIVVVVFQFIAKLICLISYWHYYYCELSFNLITITISYLNLTMTSFSYLPFITPHPPLIHNHLPPYTNNPLKSFPTNKFSILKNIFLIDYQLILPIFLVYQWIKSVISFWIVIRLIIVGCEDKRVMRVVILIISHIVKIILAGCHLLENIVIITIIRNFMAIAIWISFNLVILEMIACYYYFFLINFRSVMIGYTFNTVSLCD